MRILGDKIFVKISREARQGIFSKWITRDDGSRVQLFLNVDPEDEASDRKMALFVQTGEVVGVGEKVTGIQVGDTAIFDYKVMNAKEMLVSQEYNGDTIHWMQTETTYHPEDIIIYANRRTKKDTIFCKAGEFDELSPIMGVVRGDKLIARKPYVFLEKESALIKKVSTAGLLYEEKQLIYTRKILSVSRGTSEWLNIENGESVLLDDRNVFDIKLENRTIEAVWDIDIMAARRKKLNLVN